MNRLTEFGIAGLRFLFPGGSVIAQEMQNPGMILPASQTVAENTLPEVYRPEVPDVNTATVGEMLNYNHAVDNAFKNYKVDSKNYSTDAKAVNMSAASDMDGLNTEVEKAAATGNGLVFQDAVSQYYARSYEMTGNTLSIPQEALDAFEEASGKAISPEKESAFSALTSAKTTDELNDAYSAYKNAAPDMDAKEKADLDTNYALMSQQISGKMESPPVQATSQSAAITTTQSDAEAAFENGVAGTTPASTPANTQTSTPMTTQTSTPSVTLAQNAGIPYGEAAGTAVAPYTDAFGMPQGGASFPGGESLTGYNAGGAGESAYNTYLKLVNEYDIRTQSEGAGETFTQGSHIPDEVLKTKPLYSPDVNKWLNGGGKIEIYDNGTWKYTNSEGVSVTYKNGYPDFKGSGHVVQEVDIGQFRNRTTDFKLADQLAPNGPKNPLDTWHHNEDGRTLQEVNRNIHRTFTHKGGISIVKRGGK